MTKMQLKAIFTYGWNAHESSCIDIGSNVIINSFKLDKAFEELIQRPYITELISDLNPDKA